MNTRKVRHIQKHGPAKDWSKAENFSPLAGEAIVYDADENYPIPRLKIGDGNTNVNNLPFIGQSIIDVFSLPENDINPNVFYRVAETKMIGELQEVASNVSIFYIKSLPANGIPVLDFNTNHFTWYYNTIDGIVYGYDRKSRSSFEIDISEILEEKNRDVCMRAVNKIRSMYNDLLDMDYLVVTGGTGEAWWDMIKNEFQGLRSLTVVPGNDTSNLPFTFSNVRGYYFHLYRTVKKKK